MSNSFSLTSWLFKVPLSTSCIDGDGRHEYDDYYSDDEPAGYTKRYFALAEDFKGSHIPYPKLPRWCQRVFDVRVFIAQETNTAMRSMSAWLQRERPHWLKREDKWTLLAKSLQWGYGNFTCYYFRGRSWWFHCRECGYKSKFTFKNKECWSCQKIWRVPPQPEPRWSALRFFLAIDKWMWNVRWLRRSYRWRLRNWWTKHRQLQVTHLNAHVPRPIADDERPRPVAK